jgi:hypothetical protein
MWKAKEIENINKFLYPRTLAESALFSSCPLLGRLLPYWSTGLITQFLDLS